MRRGRLREEGLQERKGREGLPASVADVREVEKSEGTEQEEEREQERERGSEREQGRERESDGGSMAGSLFNRLSLEEAGSLNSLRSPGAMHSVLDTLSDSTGSTTANDLDLIFLKGIMESPVAHERFEEPKLEAVRENNVELVQDILKDLTPLTEQSQAANELACILSEPHFQSLLETHDSVASKSYETPPPSPCVFMDPAQQPTRPS
ncbi:hypothetical protein HF521_020227 [Silurus meridionalis]|uniref:L27 domain-containing protein n=1 Tax=Silurus meridionalis TaxID=175797 RepID=A0A8T0BCY6_SILME|nr:hypothetical protein HF521_020227 [Silurus meridionalis]